MKKSYTIAAHNYDADRWAWCLFSSDDERLSGDTVRNARPAATVTRNSVTDADGNRWMRFGDDSLELCY